MGENSGIQWTTHTFNPWVGCQRVSPGCENCYAEAYDKRVGGGKPAGSSAKQLRWGPTAPRVRTTAMNWKQPLKWDAQAKALGQRHRVFCASLADVFEDRDELKPWRLDLFMLIDSTPNLDWLLLTKRPENIGRLIPGEPEDYWNIWWGTTVEDQKRAERWRDLHWQTRHTRAIRFLSMEPLLEAVDVPCAECGGSADFHREGAECCGYFPDWIIIGGESGGHAREFRTGWVVNLLHQARMVGMAPFVKQFGSKPRDAEGDRLILHDHHGGEMDEWPEALRVREFPKPRGGA